MTNLITVNPANATNSTLPTKIFKEDLVLDFFNAGMDYLQNISYEDLVRIPSFNYSGFVDVTRYFVSICAHAYANKNQLLIENCLYSDNSTILDHGLLLASKEDSSPVYIEIKAGEEMERFVRCLMLHSQYKLERMSKPFLAVSNYSRSENPVVFATFSVFTGDVLHIIPAKHLQVLQSAQLDVIEQSFKEIFNLIEMYGAINDPFNHLIHRAGYDLNRMQTLFTFVNNIQTEVKYQAEMFDQEKLQSLINTASETLPRVLTVTKHLEQLLEQRELIEQSLIYKAQVLYKDNKRFVNLVVIILFVLLSTLLVHTLFF